eukprot:8802817-Alexandrium_andersonii.AAC.1
MRGCPARLGALSSNSQWALQLPSTPFHEASSPGQGLGDSSHIASELCSCLRESRAEPRAPGSLFPATQLA